MKITRIINGIFIIWLISSIISCSPKFSESIKSDFAIIKKDFQRDDLKYADFISSYSSTYQVFNKSIPLSDLKSNLEKEARNIKVGNSSNLISNADNSCGMIKVIRKGKTLFMRVKYIYLADKNESGEKTADLIIKEYANTKDFPNLVQKHTKDGTKEIGGDLGWFNSENMVKDFTYSIKNHNVGEVFKVLTKEYGWYVIKKTHETRHEEYIEIIKIEKENCR